MALACFSKIPPNCRHFRACTIWIGPHCPSTSSGRCVSHGRAAAIHGETAAHLIGVESKRFEPFRDFKLAKLSPKYSSHEWDKGMKPWCAMRDQLLAEPAAFRHLDAAQLVKHGYGLVTEAKRRAKSPILLYLYAEPTEGRAISTKAFADHRSEITRFAETVAGSTVRFTACSWREWLDTFPQDMADHAKRVIARFHP
jgi:hypothetical protein